MSEQNDKATPSLGLPWTLEGKHPWRIMCETNLPGLKNVVATVAYRPMAELIVRSVNRDAAFDALVVALNNMIDLWKRAQPLCCPNKSDRDIEGDSQVKEARAALKLAQPEKEIEK